MIVSRMDLDKEQRLKLRVHLKNFINTYKEKSVSDAFIDELEAQLIELASCRLVFKAHHRMKTWKKVKYSKVIEEATLLLKCGMSDKQVMTYVKACNVRRFDEVYVGIKKEEDRTAENILNRLSRYLECDSKFDLSMVNDSKTAKDNKKNQYFMKKTNKSKVVCFKCSKVGHFASQCKKPNEEKKKVDNIKKEDLWLVNCEKDGMKMKLLLDTGASCLMIRPEFIKDERVLMSELGRFTTASGDPLEIQGSASVELKFEGRKWIQKFYITKEISYDGIMD